MTTSRENRTTTSARLSSFGLEDGPLIEAVLEQRTPSPETLHVLSSLAEVRIATETQTVYGDHAVDDVDRGLLVVTGQHLKLETQHDTVTARDTLEWYDDTQLAVARGIAVEK